MFDHELLVLLKQGNCMLYYLIGDILKTFN